MACSSRSPTPLRPTNDNAPQRGRVAPGAWNIDPKTGQLRRTVRKAIGKAVIAAPALADLAERLLARAPGKPLCSRSLKCTRPASYQEPLVYAVHAPWISWNTEEATNAITVDCDHDDLDLLDDLIENLGLPRPAYVVIDPWSGRFHVTWFLATPVLMTPSASPKPKALLRRAIALLVAALRGDPNNINRLGKNPWGLRSELEGAIIRKGPCAMDPALWALFEAQPLLWRTVDYGGEPVELKDIVAALADDYSPAMPARRHRARTVLNGEGRNCTVFDRVRLWAYDNVGRYGGGMLWREALTDVANEANDFAEPLDAKELKDIVGSIYRFTTSPKFRPRGAANCNRGAMGLPEDMDLKEKQVLSGPWSAARNKVDTDKRIIEALVLLRSRGEALTREAVAAAAGISVSTLRGDRWKALQVKAAAQPADAPVPVAPPVHEPPRPVLVVSAPDGTPASMSRKPPVQATQPVPFHPEAHGMPGANAPLTRSNFPPSAAKRPPPPKFLGVGRVAGRITAPNTAERRAADYDSWLLERRLAAEPAEGSNPSSPQHPPVPGFLRRSILSAAS